MKKFTSQIDNCVIDYQVKEYIKDYKYSVTSGYMPPQFVNLGGNSNV